MSDYIIKRLSRESIEDVYNLFESSHIRGATLKEFKKKYNTEYTGKSYIGFIAYDDIGLPAAFYGVIPYLANYYGKNVLIAQSADTITHPNHQRKGLFTKLAIKTYELAKEEGFHFLFGIPNQLSYPGFIKKLNWIHFGDMKIFEFKIPTIPISHLTRMNRVTTNIYNIWVQMVLFFIEKGELKIENSNVLPVTFGIIRNKEFFLYKEYTKKYNISINSRTIWFKIDGALKIGDIEKCSTEELLRIKRKLKFIAFFLGVYKIQFQFSSNSSQIRIFEKVLKMKSGLPVIFLDFSKKYDFEQMVLTLYDLDTF